MTVLIGGFSVFPGAPENPTAALARAVDGGRTSSGEAIVGVVLPVEWERAWPTLREAIRRVRPHAVLLFGLHAGLDRLRIERVARNVRELGRMDAAGAFPSGPGVADGPTVLPAALPLDRIAGALRRAAVDFELSSDAGRYLCNDTFYNLAFHAAEEGVAEFGFLHTPLTDEALGAWEAAGALPEACRTLSAAMLQRAALAVADAVQPATA